jgi:hypothetical protein
MSKVNSNDDESDELEESSGGADDLLVVVDGELASALIKLLRRTRDGDEGCSDANMVG